MPRAARASVGEMAYHVINRGATYGGERWALRTARRLGLEASLGPRGRPHKAPEK